MHQEIKKFSLAGIIGDKEMETHRAYLEHHLEGMMRDQGYAPVLDLDPQFTVDYDVERDRFNFALTIYGVEVGDKAWDIAGVSKGKHLPNSIQRPKPKQSFKK